MDRRILVGLVLLVALTVGCSKSPPKDATASSSREPRASEASINEAQQSGANGESANASQTHRPIIVSEMTTTEGPGDDWRGKNASTPPPAPPPAGVEHYRAKTDYNFPDDVVDGSLERPRSVEVAGNPLRVGSSGQAAPAPSPNPLRTFGAAPEAAPPPDVPLAPSSAPSGGSAPPGAASAEQLMREREAQVRAYEQAEAAARAAMAAAKKQAAEAEASALKAAATDRSPLKATMAPPEDGNLYDVVQVFYGTDRQSAAASVDFWADSIRRFLPVGCSVLVTLGLALGAVSRRSLSFSLAGVLGAAVSLGLAYQAAMATLTAVRQQDKQGLLYSTARAPDGKVDLGICEVTIPKSHVVGELEAPSIVRLEVREDAARHVVLRKTERLDDEPFYNSLRERVDASARKELFVFVHGFNVSFEEAARRTAQIHYDLRFEGAPVFFSWPAHDKFLLTYPADENNVEWSAPHLKKFLLNVAQRTGSRSINLIAHSMGNRALAAALREIELEMQDQSRLFNQVILAAPDIDAADFRTNIAPAMRRTSQRMTLYASSRDDALLASQLLHRGPRAGDAGEGLVVVQGIDTIDVTAIDSSPWGHLYYGSSDPVLQDLKLLFTMASAPQSRRWLSPAEREGLTYWIFQPTRTAGAEARPGEPRF